MQFLVALLGNNCNLFLKCCSSPSAHLNTSCLTDQRWTKCLPQKQTVESPQIIKYLYQSMKVKLISKK